MTAFTLLCAANARTANESIVITSLPPAQRCLPACSSEWRTPFASHRLLLCDDRYSGDWQAAVLRPILDRELRAVRRRLLLNGQVFPTTPDGQEGSVDDDGDGAGRVTTLSLEA